MLTVGQRTRAGLLWLSPVPQSPVQSVGNGQVMSCAHSALVPKHVTVMKCRCLDLRRSGRCMSHTFGLCLKWAIQDTTTSLCVVCLIAKVCTARQVVLHHCETGHKHAEERLQPSGRCLHQLPQHFSWTFVMANTSVQCLQGYKNRSHPT